MENPFINRYVIVRAKSAACCAGYYQGEDQYGVYLSNARRIWYWAGAATLSQLAGKGTSRPKDCQFPEPMEMVRLERGDVCEIILVTDKARHIIENEIPVWSE